jgi:hypothetical protein
LRRIWIAALGLAVIVVGTMLAGTLDRTGHLPAALATPLESEATEACPAVQRWDVKTLTDDLAGDVQFSNVERTTIDKLRHLVDIGAHSHTARTGPDELRVFKVRTRMVEATIEGDGDIHLVLQNKAFRKIIVEFPDTSCAFNGATAPAQAEQMRLARQKFEDRCGRPPHGSFVKLKGSATITGVAFFDVKHSNPQHGVAPNNIELHPVLKFNYPTCPAI